MAGKTHPYLKAAYLSAFIFAALIFFVVFIALYVNSAVDAAPDISAQTVEKNITPPGKIYPRQ